MFVAPCQVPGSSALAAATAGGTCGAHSAPSACSVNILFIAFRMSTV